MKNIKQYQGSRGFTLIEMAIVMIIGGILLSFMGSALLMYVEKSRVRDTEVRMEVIKEALSQYLSVNRRYPCPARQDIAPGENPGTDPAFGREVNTDCTAGTIIGTQRTPPITRGTLTDRVRSGSVPVRSINLPDDMAFDGWGRRFTYAVTERLASVDSGAGVGTLYENDGGIISIADTSETAFVDDAHYVVVSHGRTGDGAFTYNGNETTPCPTNTKDDENCDDDGLFLLTLVNSDAQTTDFYDDYFYYQGQTAPPLLIPAGAVMAFNLDACPDGWADLAAAEGKFIIGVDDDDVPLRSYTFNTDTDTTDLDISSLGTDGNKNDTTLMPPFVAYRYCEKLPE